MKKSKSDLNLKQVMMVFLCMAVFFTAMPVMPVYAETEEPAVPMLTVNGNSAYAGNSVRVDVYASDFSAVGVMEFQIHYDPDVMTVNSCYAGNMISSVYNDINTANRGEIRVSAMNLGGINGSGRVLQIYFDVSSDVKPGDYPVTITVGNVRDTELQPVMLNKISGAVTVKERPVNPTSVAFNRMVDKNSVQQGDTLTYVLKNLNAYGLAAGNFIFTYDSSLLKLDDVILCETIDTETSITAVNNDTPGYIKISFADLDALPVEYSSELVKLKFTAVGDEDTTTSIDFAAERLVDCEANAMTAGSLTQAVTLKKKAVVIDYPDFLLTSNNDFDEETGTFTVDVSLEESAAVAAGDFDILYNKSQVVCTALTPSSEANNGKSMLIYKEKLGEGIVEFSYINTDPTENAVKLATLTFKAVEGVIGRTTLQGSGTGVKNLAFEDVILDYPALTVPVKLLKLADWADDLKLEFLQVKYDGTEKKPEVTIEGLTEGVDYTVSYSNNEEPGKALVTVTGTGNYEGQLTAEFEILDFDVLLGDVNLDGRVSAADLTMLARHISGIRPVTDIRSLANADVDRGGDVGSEDLAKLARYVAKIITTL